MDICFCCYKKINSQNPGCINNIDNMTTMCFSCIRKLPTPLVEIIAGEIRKIVYPTTFTTLDNRIIYQGTWTKDNWEQYPTIIEIRNSFAPQETKEEDHAGQIYNPFTDSWSWF